MGEMGDNFFLPSVYSFPPVLMSMFRFCLRLVTIHIKVLMLITHHYHILFYIDKLGSQRLYHAYIIIWIVS